jgi:hypothetical protein
MSAIWGHVESVVNQPKSPPNLVLNTRAPLGTRRTECIVGVGARILKGFERLSLDEIRPGDFVVATLCGAFRLVGNRKDRGHRISRRFGGGSW